MTSSEQVTWPGWSRLETERFRQRRTNARESQMAVRTARSTTSWTQCSWRGHRLCRRCLLTPRSTPTRASWMYNATSSSYELPSPKTPSMPPPPARYRRVVTSSPPLPVLVRNGRRCFRDCDCRAAPPVSSRSSGSNSMVMWLFLLPHAAWRHRRRHPFPVLAELRRLVGGRRGGMKLSRRKITCACRLPVCLYY